MFKSLWTNSFFRKGEPDDRRVTFNSKTHCKLTTQTVFPFELQRSLREYHIDWLWLVNHFPACSKKSLSSVILSALLHQSLGDKGVEIAWMSDTQRGAQTPPPPPPYPTHPTLQGPLSCAAFSLGLRAPIWGNALNLRPSPGPSDQQLLPSIRKTNSVRAVAVETSAQSVTNPRGCGQKVCTG